MAFFFSASPRFNSVSASFRFARIPFRFFRALLRFLPVVLLVFLPIFLSMQSSIFVVRRNLPSFLFRFRAFRCHRPISMGLENAQGIAIIATLFAGYSRMSRTAAVDMAIRITRLPEIFQMKASTENRENGFSLIEVLVAVFVLAVGVIGAAGMQLAALRTAQQSSFQTRALHLAAEMADYMRANVGQMRRADAVNPYLRVDYRASANSASPTSVSCYGIDAQCDADELAQFEIAEWQRRLAAALPGARTRICRDAAPWDEGGQRFRWECTAAQGHAIASIVIKIGWREKRADGRLLHEDGNDAPAIALLVAPYVE